MKLIDIESERKAAKSRKRKAARDKNKPDLVQKGPDGDYFKFSVNYTFKNKTWSFYIWAKSLKEANHRLHNIQYLPCEVIQIHAEIPA